jgi:hypothetical protein
MSRAAALLGAALIALALAAAPAAAAPPVVSYTLSGPVGANGWFVGPVTVKWSVSGEDSTTGCDTVKLSNDTPGTQITCTATNASGTFPKATELIKIDQTPPTSVTAVPARPPDHPPWYTASLLISWSGKDATSGVAACTALNYSGPDGASVAPAGACRDVAGNASAGTVFPLAYDATPPALADLAATVAGTSATLRWTPGADTDQVTVVRQPGDAGAGARTLLDAGPGTTRELGDGPLAAATAYTWTATVRDAAGNATTASTTASTPAPVATASAAAKDSATTPKALTWRARSRAKYYNFQLFRNGRKLLSAWPTRAHYTVRPTWRYRGRTHRLATGVYRWYVWPGYGLRAHHRYGRLLAKGKLTIR